MVAAFYEVVLLVVKVEEVLLLRWGAEVLGLLGIRTGPGPKLRPSLYQRIVLLVGPQYVLDHARIGGGVEVDVTSAEDSHVVVPVFQGASLLPHEVDFPDVLEDVLPLVNLHLFSVSGLGQRAAEHIRDVDQMNVSDGVDAQVCPLYPQLPAQLGDLVAVPVKFEVLVLDEDGDGDFYILEGLEDFVCVLGIPPLLEVLGKDQTRREIDVEGREPGRQSGLGPVVDRENARVDHPARPLGYVY